MELQSLMKYSCMLLHGLLKNVQTGMHREYAVSCTNQQQYLYSC